MIVKEGALVRAMKEAWKHGGYKVVGYEVGGELWIGIYSGSGYWLVEMEMTNVPRKALGLIAEHAGKLPGKGEAYTIRKDDDVQDEIHATAMEPILEMWREIKDEGNAQIRAKRTDLHWRRLRVWQRADNLAVILMNPDYMGITETPKNVARLVGNALYVEGLVSRAYIFRVLPQEDEKIKMDHLGQMQWVDMK